ncbi:DUF5131 family protein [Desulfosporosinus nitroreducens]|uniref:DUF5131 family protein n=1 Tax=Desulfosporosinus nitroreducens TaxID=2018668 RepID=UPI00207C9B5C|nr:phage Gp37/Gp68 family protein [Desulfosporosinus nitroreducens]MCO1599844.1 phage Gp37/Gp68 family protein [Desulfosporosinus nitroreducens]
MAESKIEWTDAVWNPVTGCSKVSAGCAHCYAERLWPRLRAMGNPAYKDRSFNDVACHPERLEQPLGWRKPRRIFVNSMSDLFHQDVPLSFLSEVFDVMRLAKQHTFMILTKRPEGLKWLRLNGPIYDDKPLPNVWLGVSVENQAAADERIPLLLQTPAAVRFISAEPLLGPVDLQSDILGDTLCRCGGCMDFAKDNPNDWGAQRIDWVIVGGESGPGARPVHPDWVRNLRDQCHGSKVPFFFKQWGEWGWYQGGHHSMKYPGTFVDDERFKAWMVRVGKKKAGRELDGQTWDEMPEVSR